MSFRGRGRGGGGGTFQRGGGSFSRGGRGGFAPQGPPASVLEMGTFMHATEGEMICTSTNIKIPYFNAPIFLENKTPIGKVDEILGPVNQVYFTIKPQEGIVATSFKQGDKFFIGGDKLLPLEKFLPKPKPPPGASKVRKPAGAGGRGGARGGMRGGRGAPRGSFRGGRGGAPGGRGGRGSFGGGSSFGARGGGFSSRGGAPRGRGRGASRY